MPIRDLLLDAWALVMPVECAGCGAPDRSLCAECAAELIPAVTPRSTPGGLRVTTALRYEGTVRHILLAYKEHQRTDVAAALARPLAAALLRAGGPTARVEYVAVPTSRAAYRRRGYDPVVLLLRRARHPPSRVLRASRRTARQKSLGVVGRADNVRGAFGARGDLRGRSFLIVDDVLTTGATLDEAARAIRQAGGTVVGAATLAFTPRMYAARDNGSTRYYGGAKGAQQ